ncbi:MAG: hypothetical protein MRY83_17930 [Flavobacteriales bacterium]|nr:hypothetical protein [Flavobacteriales bacterium]
MNIKFEEVFECLNDQEKIRFQQFVRSDYFNSNPKLKTCVGLGPEVLLDYKRLYKSLYPKSQYDAQKVYDIYSQLNTLLSQFLAIEHLASAPNQQDIMIMDRLQTLGATNSLKHYSRRFEKKLTQSKGESKFLGGYKFHALLDKDFIEKGSREKDNNLQRKVDYLDLHYFTQKLKTTCEMFNRQHIINEKYNINFIQEVENFIENRKSDFSEFVQIQMYLNILKMIRDNDSKAFFSLKEILDQEVDLDDEELKHIFNYAQNFCVQQVNKGNAEYTERLFELYQRQILSGIILQKDVIGEWDFKTIITVGLRLKKYQWTEHFIIEFGQKLSEDVRKNAYSFNLANFYYETGDFRKAIRILSGVQFTDIYYNLGARSLLLKTYYDMEDEEAFEAHCIAFSYFVKRNKLISQYQRRVHLNLIRFSKKCLSLKMVQPKHINNTFNSKIETLETKVTATKEINNLKWLNDRIQKLRSI